MPAKIMQTLRSFLQQHSGEKPVHGQPGRWTDWLPLCKFQLRSGKVCVCDPAFAPPQPDVEVQLTLLPGEYEIEGRGIAYGSDRRVGALRCVRTKTRRFEPGDMVGEVGVDTGRIGLCDEEVFSAAVDKIGEDAFNELLDSADSGAGFIEVAPGAVLPFVDSGFGDGSYPVRELRAGEELIGFEVSLIEEARAYPFGEPVSPAGGSPDSEPRDGAPSDAVREFFAKVVAKAKQKEGADEQTKREAFKDAFKEMMSEQVRKLRNEVEEFRKHLVAQRKAAPIIRTVTHPGPAEVLEKPDVSRQRGALEAAGYILQGTYEFVGIPGFVLILFVHPGNGTTATISCGKQLTTELAAEYPDGRGFYVRDTPPTRGMTPPPWATYRHEAGRSVPDLVAVFESSRAPGNLNRAAAEVAESLATDFYRIQSWRLERGGWNRVEIQAQLGIEDRASHEERITDACMNVREKWLYAWFKDQDPNRAERLLEKVIIVHDDLDSSVLFFLWVMGGASTKVRRAEFEGSSARETFQKVNEAYRQPLKRIAQKTSGYAADYYEPAELSETKQG